MYHQEGRFVEAFTTLEEALIAAEQSGFTRTQALAQNSLGDLLLDVQDTQQATTCHARALELATQLGDSFLMFYEKLAQIRLARQAGGFDQAHALLVALMAEEEGRTAYREALLKTEEGCCLLGIGQPVEASASLQGAIQLLLQGGRAQESCALRLWLVAALGQTDVTAGLAEFDALMSQGCNLQAPGPLYVTAVQCQPWLRQLAEDSSQAHEPFRKFLHRVQKYGDDFASIRRQLRHVSKRVELSPPRIEVRALGPVQITRDGQSLTLSDWQTKEARDLFLFLLFAPAQTKEQIALVFWPDISPARLRMRFKTDVYRIRQALGQNVILFEDEFYRFNRAIDYSCDVDEFHALLEDARKSTDPQRSLAALKAAIDLVHGPFLADMDFGWVSETRTSLAKEQSGALFELAEAYLSVAEPEHCLEATERLLALDPVQEKVHRLRMQAFAALRDRAGLVRQFQECRDVLQRELGVLPSNETAMLFERLVA
jgi:DNA-binding SARP family transcriptional activator